MDPFEDKRKILSCRGNVMNTKRIRVHTILLAGNHKPVYSSSHLVVLSYLMGNVDQKKNIPPTFTQLSSVHRYTQPDKSTSNSGIMKRFGIFLNPDMGLLLTSTTDNDIFCG